MCGIAGITEAHYHAEKILRSLYHRGPDAQEYFSHENITLFHTRLAIQDIQNGAQPLSITDFTIVFNGEIYNHEELRKRIKRHSFKTKSDTETLLALFIEYGPIMLNWLDGMFAFAIYDKKSNVLWLARDRAGKKPLYYSNQTYFAFASELNALKILQPVTLNHEAINCFLRIGFIWREHTPYQEVFELEAGSYLNIHLHTKKINKCVYFNMLDYYQLPKFNLSFNKAKETLDHYLKDSVQSRLVTSDVEVGVFLSGGIDSNLIAAYAAPLRPRIKTFTVKTNTDEDESKLAKITATQYQTEHIELDLTTPNPYDINNILNHYGEPFMDSSAIPTFLIAKAASHYVKVILSGDGADELFAGYKRYVPIQYNLHRIFKKLNFLAHFIPNTTKKHSILNLVKRLMTLMGKDSLNFYLSATTDIFEDHYCFSQNSISDEIQILIHSIMINEQLSELDKLLLLDFKIILFNDLLVKMDIASMANSLEVRSPFLTKTLLEWAPRLPNHYKIKGLKTKFILRQLAKKYLSPHIINQPKRGFEIPLAKWINHSLKPTIQDFLKKGAFVENYVDAHFIYQLLNNKLDISPIKTAKMIWALYCLEVWKHHEKNYHFSR